MNPQPHEFAPDEQHGPYSNSPAPRKNTNDNHGGCKRTLESDLFREIVIAHLVAIIMHNVFRSQLLLMYAK